MFHQNVKEFMPQVDHGLFLEDLPPGFNLYIDGHLHKNYEIQKQDKLLLIPGSTVLTQLKKEEKIKGFYLYDTANKEFNFIEIPTRKFYYLEYDSIENDLLKQKDEITNLMNSIDYSSKPIVRLDLKSDVDTNVISFVKQAFGDKCYLFLNGSLKEKNENLVDELEREFESETTVKEKGMIILKEMLTKNNYKGLSAEEMFDFLCDTEEQEIYDKYIDVIK